MLIFKNPFRGPQNKTSPGKEREVVGHLRSVFLVPVCLKQCVFHGIKNMWDSSFKWDYEKEVLHNNKMAQ